ncbi:MAG: phosphoribosylamine--glycine ligase [Acidobacteria bacterium]|nr:phosphoribosylamine--glycine ligase [Acidobacteriota bacterium]
MKILVIGSGGREHAVCRSFQKSGRAVRLYCADGNAGIAALAECVPIKPDEIEKLAGFAESEAIDLTFVGGETALALGITDEFEKRGLKIVGVSGSAARLEASKAFAKDFMARHGIPTARYRTAFSTAEARAVLDSGFFGDERAPAVVKADGLAAGKGVVVAPDRAAAVRAIEELENLVGRAAAEKIVLEECLVGREVSLLAFCDGENFALMPPVRDHKRIGEGDTGPNTGGMGTISDRSLLTAEQIAQIAADIIEPTLAGARADGFPIRGILFLGLMLTVEGIKVLEYNVRFGDPETQVILIQLETDLVEICEAMLGQTLDRIEIEWRPGSAACVVLAAENYPNRPRTGDRIDGLEAAAALDHTEIFHAGTKRDAAGRFVTAGGRVLGVTAVGDDLPEALERAYRAVAEISWDGMQFRRDIGGSLSLES